MRPWIRCLTVMLTLAVLAGCSSTNWVARKDESPIYRAPRKLARGTVNIFCGPLEIFKQPIRLAGKEENFAGQFAGAVAGIPVGLGYAVGRTFAGTFDVVTAPILVPQRALIEPEFMTPDLANWAFGD